MESTDESTAAAAESTDESTAAAAESTDESIAAAAGSTDESTAVRKVLPLTPHTHSSALQPLRNAPTQCTHKSVVPPSSRNQVSNYWCREVLEGGDQGERGFVATEERRGAESVCGLWADAYRRSNRVNKVNPPPLLVATEGGAQRLQSSATRE